MKMKTAGPMKNRRFPMKTIGLIGGMSWESTVPHYKAINRAVAARGAEGRLAVVLSRSRSSRWKP